MLLKEILNVIIVAYLLLPNNLSGRGFIIFSEKYFSCLDGWKSCVHAPYILLSITNPNTIIILLMFLTVLPFSTYMCMLFLRGKPTLCEPYIRHGH